MANDRAYMDWNATAPLLPSARARMVDVLDMAGNPSSVHREGRAVRTVIEEARRSVAALVGAAPQNVTFTSGATEAACHVLTPHFRMGRSLLEIGHLMVSAIEHKAIGQGGRFARDQISVVPVTRDGVIDMEALESGLDAQDPANGLVMLALMLANNENGIIQPVREAARLVHAKGGLMVVDAVQAAGRLPVDIHDLDADFLILSSHKIGGPKGAGALVARGEAMMPTPLISGGGQEKGHRSGTENAAAIAGFGVAAREMASGIEARARDLALMRDRMEVEFRAIAPAIQIHGASVDRLPNTSFFSLAGLKAETGQIAFDLEGVALSAGSACTSGKVGESHVLAAMGLDARHGALRLSIGASTTTDEVDRTLEAFRRIVGRLKPVASAA
jgi:cysteine desulfurase